MIQKRPRVDASATTRTTETRRLARRPGATSASGLAVRALVRNQPSADAALHLAALLRAQRRIIGALPDSVAVTSAVVTEARKLTSAKTAVLELVDGSDLVCHASCGAGAPAVGERTPLGESVVQSAMRAHGSTSSDEVDDLLEATVRVVPLAYRGRVIGAVTVRSAETPFHALELQALQILGSAAAYAVGCSLEYDLRERMASLGRLAAGMGHEINNPLAYVSGNISYVLELLAEAPPGPFDGDGARQALEDAQRGASRIASVVAQLRAFSRGSVEARQRVDLEQVLRHSARMAAHEIRNRARLVETYGPAPAVFGNEVQLGQVFLNMLVNAGQSIAVGRENAEVAIRLSRSSDGAAVVEIADTGDGIAQEDLARIFEPFFTTKPVGVGTGLGLSISYGIVSAHGGDIVVESVPGEGTCFRVTLPAAPADVLAAPRASVSGRYRTARCRILVVDDAPATSSSLSQLLARHYDVETCSSSALALAELASASAVYDVIVCDATSGDRTFADLHRTIGARRPELAGRFVFLTARAFPAETEAYLASLPNVRIARPHDLTRLREGIDGVFAAGRLLIEEGR